MSYTAASAHISIDTKFTDPLTGNNITSTFNTLSDPDLTYYGPGTEREIKDEEQ